MERKRYYTPGELAAEVGISHDTVLRMIHSGRLYAVKLGPRTYRIPLGSALAVFAPHEIAPGERTALEPGAGDAFFDGIASEEASTVVSAGVERVGVIA